MSERSQLLKTPPRDGNLGGVLAGAPTGEGATWSMNDMRASQRTPQQEARLQKGGASEYSAQVAFYRRYGARQILDALLWALIVFEAGLFLTTELGLFTTLGLIPPGPTAVIFAPLWMGHAFAAAWHVRAFMRLKDFLYAKPPDGARTPQTRAAHSMRMAARREKLPFVRAFILMSGQLFVTSSLFLAFDVCLFVGLASSSAFSGGGKGADGHDSSHTLVTAGGVSAPIIILAILNIVNGVLCRGASPLRMGAAVTALIQLLVLAQKIDDGLTTGYTIVLLPTFALLAIMMLILMYQMSAHFVESWRGRPIGFRSRLLTQVQVEIAWGYLIGVACLLLTSILVAFQLDQIGTEMVFTPNMAARTIGRLPCYLTGAAFTIGNGCVLWSVYRVAVEKARLFVDYTGAVKPQPLVRDASGEWVVREEEAWCVDDCSFIGPSTEIGEDGDYRPVVGRKLDDVEDGAYLPTR